MKIQMKKKKRIAIILVILLLVFMTVALFLWHRMQERNRYDAMQLTFTEDTVIEYGSQKDAESLILSYSGGTLKEISELDTSIVGKQRITYTMENDGVRRTFTHEVEIRDTTAPQILFHSDSITIEAGATFDPSKNIRSVSDPIDGDLPYLSDNDADEACGYRIQSDVDPLTAGHYTVTVTARNANGNTEEASYPVDVHKEASDSVDVYESAALPPATDGATYIDGILLVNKQYALPQNYGNGLDATAYQAFLQLQADAAKAGHSIPLVSGYRSYSYQAQLYDSYVARDGQAAADRYSARPGHSEHQSGLAMDVGAIDNNYGQTPAGQWLNAHCAEYGFILRYPQGKESITGYMYEPWHIRYVGSAAAKAIMANGLTLEEYLGVA